MNVGRDAIASNAHGGALIAASVLAWTGAQELQLHRSGSGTGQPVHDGPCPACPKQGGDARREVQPCGVPVKPFE